MRTYSNKHNENAKALKKASKEFRKLRQQNGNTHILKGSGSVKDKFQQPVDYDYDQYEETIWI